MSWSISSVIAGTGITRDDDPTYTQPVMYQKIKAQPSVLNQYGHRLVREKLCSPDDVDARKKTTCRGWRMATTWRRRTLRHTSCRKSLSRLRPSTVDADQHRPRSGTACDHRNHDHCRPISISIRS